MKGGLSEAYSYPSLAQSLLAFPHNRSYWRGLKPGPPGFFWSTREAGRAHPGRSVEFVNQPQSKIFDCHQEVFFLAFNPPLCPKSSQPIKTNQPTPLQGSCLYRKNGFVDVLSTRTVYAIRLHAG